jgi:hypothetical protein
MARGGRTNGFQLAGTSGTHPPSEVDASEAGADAPSLPQPGNASIAIDIGATSVIEATKVVNRAK